MSQNVTTDPSVLEPDHLSHPTAHPSDLPSEDSLDHEATSTQASGFSANSYADRLMDELFEEVEGMLDRGAKTPSEPAKPEFISLQSLSIPKMVLPSLVPTRPQLQEADEPDLDSLALAIATETETHRNHSTRSVDRVLMVAACASLAATAALWFAFHNRLPQPIASETPASPGDTAAAGADKEFQEYMRRSLEAIERRAETNEQTASASSTVPPSATNLPSVNVPGNPIPGGTAGVPERVYIPVYQPPQASALPGVAVSPLPPNATVTVPAAPQTAVATAPRAVPNISSANANHVLVGLLELDGDRSAALFEINGTTQRIRIGEGVGSSGWTLVSVNNGEAIVRRNGEVRSIFVGQSF
ncbi:hypothetical protein H6G89_05510 [Oscillatoria sp. FACHB-1407]|uniref:hypothetical protein n=1 Tax=Oscillatoria sp. FACHB-1407 TaxID=2692847 RepID=UPI0016868A8E|nr:hypothetical protein [Oscillatoria sp. FACHB-1407]MBD2460497.1 hypothetical protein [Oscillatoria sp. FACHB-1407]